MISFYIKKQSKYVFNFVLKSPSLFYQRYWGCGNLIPLPTYVWYSGLIGNFTGFLCLALSKFKHKDLRAEKNPIMKVVLENYHTLIEIWAPSMFKIHQFKFETLSWGLTFWIELLPTGNEKFPTVNKNFPVELQTLHIECRCVTYTHYNSIAFQI